MRSGLPCCLVVATLAWSCGSTPIDPRFHDVKRTSVEYRSMVRRACELAIWGMPAVGIQGITSSTRRDLGGDVGDIVYFSRPMESRHGFLTANDVTPYVVASLTCEGDPLIVDIPAASETISFFGTFVDAWDTPIADIGPSGDDEGEGGRYLFFPPDHGDDIPEASLVYQPRTYSVNFAFRPVSKNGGTLEEAVAYARTLKVFRMSQAGDPPETRFLDAYPKTWNTLPQYDISYFHDLAAVIHDEPALERDKAMLALAASLGIEKGKPFEPDLETVAALEAGVALAYEKMQADFTSPGRSMQPFWEGSQWQVWKFAEGQAEAGFPYETDDRLLIDERAGGAYFWITYLPKQLGSGTFYLTSLHDSDGELLDGTSTYRLNVPADTPAEDFWSAIAYSLRTKGFVANAPRVGLSTRTMDQMQVNADGSVDLYLAPEAPSGLEANWIPTGEDFFVIFRLYGPGESLFDKSWTLTDIEKVD